MELRAVRQVNRWNFKIAFALALLTSSSLLADAPHSASDIAKATKQVADDFESTVRPLLNKYCMDCHSGDDPSAKLDVAEFAASTSVVSRWHTWQAMVSRTKEHEMPPADFGSQPTDQEIEILTRWTQQFRDVEANRHAGDPGPNSTRRLNNAEYNYSIRDITGVDIRPTASFPIDAANAAGFDNSAESLTLSPALITKYLDAAKQVADHMVLTPEGIEFSSFSVVTDTDRDKYSVQRIVDFYRTRPTKISDYLSASLLVGQKLKSTDRDSTEVSENEVIQEVAKQRAISPKYLGEVYTFLTQSELTYGPGKTVQQRWKELLEQATSASESAENSVQEACTKLEKELIESRMKLRPKVSVIPGPNGMGAGSQPVILQKNALVAESRRSCVPSALLR